jgi:hypothetical protein
MEITVVVAAPEVKGGKSGSRHGLRHASDSFGGDPHGKPDVLVGQRLADRVALIVMTTAGEGEEFEFEVRQPITRAQAVERFAPPPAPTKRTVSPAFRPVTPNHAAM